MRIDGSSGFSASAPELAADPGGDVMAVWLQGEVGSDFGQRVLASRFTADGWQMPVTLNIETPSLPVYPPKLASDGQGGFFVVWSQALAMEDDPGMGVCGRRYVLGNGWEPVATLYAGNDGGSASGALDIASDGQGSATAVWTGHDALWSRATIHAARYTAGQGWSPEQIVSTDGVQSATSPAVAMDVGGNAMLVWGQAAGDNQAAKGAQAARYAVGSGWERPTAIEPADLAETRSSAVSRVGFDPAGQAIAVWSHSAQPGIYANRWAAIGWGSATALPGASTTGADEDVRLAIDPQGSALILWNHQAGGLYASRCVVGGVWGSPEVVDPARADSGRIAVDRDGRAVAVWVRHAEGASVLVASRFIPGTGWTSESVGSQAGDVSDPQIAIDGAGMATLLWRQDQGLYAARSRVGVP